MGKVVCGVCNKSCKGQAIRLGDKHFHVECFRCFECEKPLTSGGFYSKDNVHYCVDDYQRLYGTRCDICGEFAEGEVITALGKTYHDYCFHCSRCRQKFASGDKVTSFGKEYLCNSCLSREPTPVTELHMLSSASDADDDTGKMYKTDYNSVSAPATPARKDVSATARTAMMTDADSSLEMSTRSLLDVQNIDGERYRGQSRLSPIHNIMRYRSASPVAVSHQSKDSLESDRTSVSRGFDVDYGRFYNTSYLKTAPTGSTSDTVPSSRIDYRRSPSLSASQTRVRHYHRPQNDNFSYSRRPHRTSNRGLLTLLASQNYTSSDDKTPHDSEPSYKPDDVTTREVVKMSKLPDAHQPSDDEIPAIERSDWPAPPHPAAAYPELLRDHDGSNSPGYRCRRRQHRKSSETSSLSTSMVNGSVVNTSSDKENIQLNDSGDVAVDYDDDNVITDVKTEREINELSKMTDSGAAMVILEDLRKKKLEKSTLDPRSSSRTPSAATEPPYRPRYDSPVFASPSRHVDERRRLLSTESLLVERKYRTATLPLSLKPGVGGYGLGDGRRPVTQLDYYISRHRSTDDLDMIGGSSERQRPRPATATAVSSATELRLHHRQQHRDGSSQSSVDNLFDPVTGLRRNSSRSGRVSRLSTDGCFSPYPGYHRSVPSLFKPEEPLKTYTCEQLKSMVESVQFAADVDRESLERYLEVSEFESVFSMTLEEFYRLAEWKRNDVKARVGLF